MILINLLPHREEARKRHEQDFQVRLLLAVIAGLVLGGLVWKYYDYQINVQEEVNQYIEAENKKLDEKIQEVKDVEAEIAALRERQQAVEGRFTPYFIQNGKISVSKSFLYFSAQYPRYSLISIFIYLLHLSKNPIASSSFFIEVSSASVMLRKGVRFFPRSRPISFMIRFPPTIFPR